MAGIDKIYGTEDQFIEFKNWLEVNKPDAIKYLYHGDYASDPFFKDREKPISNFPEEVDRWLLKNCDIDWVISRIKDQYGLEA